MLPDVYSKNRMSSLFIGSTGHSELSSDIAWFEIKFKDN